MHHQQFWSVYYFYIDINIWYNYIAIKISYLLVSRILVESWEALSTIFNRIALSKEEVLEFISTPCTILGTCFNLLKGYFFFREEKCSHTNYVRKVGLRKWILCVWLVCLYMSGLPVYVWALHAWWLQWPEEGVHPAPGTWL